MSRKNRNKRQGFFSDRFWETDNYNARTFQKNFDMLLSLALNRFRWIGLPETCDARYLEWVLHRIGIATLSYDASQPTRVYTTLQAMPYGQYNMYGIPPQWRAVGYDGLTDYECDNDNAVLCYYNNSRFSPWNALEIFARKMTHYERTEDVNLTNQMQPYIYIAPQEKKMELVNLVKQIQGGEPAVLGDTGLLDLVEKVTAIDTKTPIITEELARSNQNVLNQALLYLGIPHLAFEKGERMIEDEARANTAPTNVMLLDCLKARRDFCETVNGKFGLDVQVVFNDDYESYNWNYTHNIEQMAQDEVSNNDV